MQTWEYLLIDHAQGKVISINDKQVGKLGFSSIWKGPSLTDYLQESGADGWEAVGISDNKLLMKRPRAI